jgi:hypothetical protein
MNTPVLRRWFKEMSRADAQQPRSGTNPTGHLTLTKNGFPIEHTTYFRRTFFGDLSWSVARLRGRMREEVTVPVEVVIDGRRIGTRNLVVDHNPDYEASQRNRTSLLHWGDNLNVYLRNNNVVGKYVSLERLVDGTCTLTIDQRPTGPFIR